MSPPPVRPGLVLWPSALAAAGLLLLGLELPLWRMTLEAPQYPQGLHLRAYGDRIEGDLREINIINHYIGMGKLEPVPAPEMELFGLGMAALLILVVLAPLHRRLHYLAIAATAAMPLVILADLQLWLHRFGRDLDPTAPLRQKPFTPLALGVSKIGNFTTTGSLGWGFLCLLGAAAVLALGLYLARRPQTSGAEARSFSALPVAGGLLALLAGMGTVGAAASGPGDLQGRIDAAPAGATVVVEGGRHRGPLVVAKPLTLIGVGRPVIDGGGVGSVVTLEGEGVIFRGFEVRNSGRHVTEEAAGIEVRGDRHRVEDNRVVDVYFGIHLADGAGNLVRGNVIAPGIGRGDRPGHALSLWYQRGTRVEGNRVRAARDGIYLSFTEDLVVTANQVVGCRYGIHSMYSQDATVTHNLLARNLVGAALMYSERLVLSGNRIAEHRTGATAYGVLLKDIGDLLLADNEILANRVGIYADGVPLAAAQRAVVRGNRIAGNETALALQSNVRLLAHGNAIVENLTELRAEGAGLSPENRWSEGGRGNYWGDYRGYDRDGDGIGDLPHRVAGALDGLVGRNPQARALLYTPAHDALEAAARLFPLFRRAPLAVDQHPLMRQESER